MSEKEKPVTTGQYHELSVLRRAGAPVEAALYGLISELPPVAVPVSDFADAFDAVVVIEKEVGPLGARVQEIIARLTSGGVQPKSEIHIVQAKVLWDRRFGQALGFGTFDRYLKGSDSIEPIPVLPMWPPTHLDRFNRDILVDKRVLAKVGQVEVCRLLGLAYNGSDDTFEAYDPKREKNGIYWMHCQDGYRNRGRRPSDCCASLASFEVGGDAFEACSVFGQDSKVIDGHYMDAIGSMHRGLRGNYACLGCWGDGPELGWSCFDDPFPRYGSFSRAE